MQGEAPDELGPLGGHPERYDRAVGVTHQMRWVEICRLQQRRQVLGVGGDRRGAGSESASAETPSNRRSAP